MTTIETIDLKNVTGWLCSVWLQLPQRSSTPAGAAAERQAGQRELGGEFPVGAKRRAPLDEIPGSRRGKLDEYPNRG